MKTDTDPVLFHMDNTSKQDNSTKIVIGIGTGLFTLGVLLFTFASIYNRFWSDDWCYNATFLRLGFVGTMKGYSNITLYASNRYSLTLFSGLLYYLRVFGVQIMTPILILAWWSGIYILIRKLLKTYLRRSPKWLLTLLPLFASALIVFISIYLAPHRYQSFYYRSAVLPYTAPMVVSLWIIILLISLSQKSSVKWYGYGLLFLVVFLGGGFSEAGAAFIATSIILSLVFHLVLLPKATWKERYLLQIYGTALMGILLAMTLLIASPTTSYRVGLYGEPANIITELPELIIRYTREFFITSILGMPLQHTIIFGLTSTAGYFTHSGTSSTNKRNDILRISIFLLFATIAMLLLIMTVFAPSAYIEKFAPAPRTQILARFVLTAYLVLTGYAAGQVARQVFFHKIIYYVSIGVILLGYLYAARAIWLSTSDVSIYRDRASIWDRRHALILDMKAQGYDGVVDVPAADSSLVGGIKDLDVRETHYVNRCAARYYQVEGLRNTVP